MANSNGWVAKLTNSLGFTKPIVDVEQKFTPQDPTVNWQYVNHLVYTANTTPYGYDGSGDGNSAVFACLRVLADATTEAPLRVFQKIGDESEPVDNSPIMDLLDEPHPDLDILELRWWISWSRHLDGNAYLMKVRSGNPLTGNVVELWPVSPSVMRPKTDRASSNFIDYYEMDSYDGRGVVRIEKENVIHFKNGVDPKDPRKGISAIKRLIREVASDGEATRYQDALLRNFGAPGLIASMPSETMLSPKQIEELKRDIEARFSGDRRGSVGVLTGGAKMEQFGFSPTEMALKVLHDVPETRIAAVMGVPPSMANLGVGLEQTSNFASARQMSENFTETTIGPIWRRDAAKWTRGLAREFTSDRSISIQHDTSEVRSLQEDENEKAKRIVLFFAGGVITREEARREAGYDTQMQAQETLWLPNTAQLVTVEQGTTDLEAERAREDAQAAAQAQALASRNPPANNQAAKGNSLDDRLADVLNGLVESAQVGMSEDLAKLQASQKRRVQRALIDGTVH